MTASSANPIEALLAAAAEALSVPLPGRVVGEPVKVVAVERQGNDRRGLVARVRRRSRLHEVSLADLQVDPDSPLGAIVDRYRELVGLAPAARSRGDGAIEPGTLVELVVLAVKDGAAPCRMLDGEPLTFRSSDVWDLVPGEIAVVRARKRWWHAGTTYLSGEVESSRLDVGRLGLVPLRLEPHGTWDPAEEDWGEGDEIPEWAASIFAAGPRPAFEMEQVLPGADPANWETDPIIDAAELHQAGDVAGARVLLMKELREDLRCLDAHAHLGNLAFDGRPEEALRHYEAGVRIGDLSLGPGFDGVLAWGWIDNRPFLRCLHGHGLALWALGRIDEAEAVFRRMLRLNPGDNQGVRFLLDEVEDRRSYASFRAEEEEARHPYGRSSRARKRVRVDLGDLCLAREDHVDGHAWYLDTETGEVVLLAEGVEEEFLPASREEIEDGDRFLAVEPEESGTGWQDMADFVATVSEPHLRDRLADAIGGAGAFGRFRRVLSEAPEERERWFAFKGERSGARALRWLASHGIEVEGGGR